jgi:cation diffusion facilitator CzcD-associated flavoprotein CzcO
MPLEWAPTDLPYQLADWLESYAHSLELNVWTSSTVIKASQDPSTHYWSVTVKRADGRERVLHPHHLVFAVGFGSMLNMPVYPGIDEFEGQVCIRVSTIRRPIIRARRSSLLAPVRQASKYVAQCSSRID